MTILDEIIAYKKKEILSCKEIIPADVLKKNPHFSRNAYSLKEAVLNPQKTGIITEFKRKSPSKGIINDKVKVEDVTKGYAAHGASALSVLTDFNFFGGSIDDLIAARSVNQIPILRKEFIIDDYQIIEAKSYGADAILLIASVLTAKELSNLYETAHNLGLEVLVEVHTEEEVNKINGNADLVGINNRNLKDFTVNIDNSIRLAEKLPSSMPKVAESGINSPETIKKLKSHGFHGFLIGENFMKTENPAKSFGEFVKAL